MNILSCVSTSLPTFTDTPTVSPLSEEFQRYNKMLDTISGDKPGTINMRRLVSVIDKHDTLQVLLSIGMILRRRFPMAERKLVTAERSAGFVASVLGLPKPMSDQIKTIADQKYTYDSFSEMAKKVYSQVLLTHANKWTLSDYQGFSSVETVLAFWPRDA